MGTGLQVQPALWQADFRGVAKGPALAHVSKGSQPAGWQHCLAHSVEPPVMAAAPAVPAPQTPNTDSIYMCKRVWNAIPPQQYVNNAWNPMRRAHVGHRPCRH